VARPLVSPSSDSTRHGRRFASSQARARASSASRATASRRASPQAAVQAGAGRSQDYTYDRFGNLKTITTDGNTGAQVKLGVSPTSNRIDNTNAPYNAWATYDTDGRVTSYLGNTFAYDAVDMPNDATVDWQRRIYLYSAADERIASVVVAGNPAVKTGAEWTLRDPNGQVLRRFTEDGAGTLAWREDYIYRNGQMLASEVDTADKTLHFHLDHLGTPRLITGNGGTKISEHQYYPFGLETTSPFQDAERRKFTGHERDASNLDYLHARYYTPQWGRFLSVDPELDLQKALSEPQLWNRYTYVTNNPLKYVDDDGRERLISRAALPSPEYARQNAASTIKFVRGATRYDDIREAVTGMQNAPANEKWMGAAVIFLSVADLGSAFLAPEEKGGIAGAEAIAFKTFNAFKARFGAAGARLEWHHIVEQTASNAAKFGAEALHNSVNLVRLDKSTHRAISAYYSSKQSFTGGMTVRQWLSSKSFKEQYEFGQRIMNVFLKVPH